MVIAFGRFQTGSNPATFKIFGFSKKYQIVIVRIVFPFLHLFVNFILLYLACVKIDTYLSGYGCNRTNSINL